VVTRPDRSRGRSKKMLPSAVKALCQEKWPELPVFSPERASTSEFVETVEKLGADLFVVVAYGEIIKTNLLTIPLKGCINIHASLLPKYRGAAPIQRSIMDGEKESGVTIMEMVLKMDAGAILEVEKVAIPHSMNFGELEQALCNVAKPALLRTIEKIEENTLVKIDQDESNVTFAPKISLEDRLIDWKKGAGQIHNQIRGLSPSPGAFCFVEIKGERKRLMVKKAIDLPEVEGEAGQTLIYEKGEWVVGCGNGALSLLLVQLEGKKPMSVEDFLRGSVTVPLFVD